jgi:hypothetical protein
MVDPALSLAQLPFNSDKHGVPGAGPGNPLLKYISLEKLPGDPPLDKSRA